MQWKTGEWTDIGWWIAKNGNWESADVSDVKKQIRSCLKGVPFPDLSHLTTHDIFTCLSCSKIYFMNTNRILHTYEGFHTFNSLQLTDLTVAITQLTHVTYAASGIKQNWLIFLFSRFSCNLSTECLIVTNVSIEQSWQLTQNLLLPEFWVVALCSLVKVYRRFRGACCLPSSGRWERR
jgi:hypothetical protein